MISVPRFPQTVTQSLHQAWRKTPEPGFRPATVHLGWEPGILHIHAELTDDAIFTKATGFNEHLWELGDAFEMFLRPLPGEMYLEYHVAPGNRVMQARFPDANLVQAMRKGTVNQPFDTLLIKEPMFKSVTTEGKGQWQVKVTLPEPSIWAGGQWKFSFSRYDASPNSKELVLSSTSAHTVLDFHDQNAWQTMIFKE